MTIFISTERHLTVSFILGQNIQTVNILPHLLGQNVPSEWRYTIIFYVLGLLFSVSLSAV